jgi:sphingolipid delta-4 desaturase
MGKGADGSTSAARKNVDVFDPSWKRPVTNKDFIWSEDPEPHRARNRAILKAHPEIKELFGHEPLTKYVVVFLVALQCSCAYLLRDMAWSWQFFVTAYFIGATATQALFLAIHEITHNLGFKSFEDNKMFNIFANLPIALPYCASFKGYHLEHHKYQGLDGTDTDLPTKFEALVLSNVFGKVFFATCQILFYALRPCIVRKQTFSSFHAKNFAIQIAFNAAVIYNFGLGPIWYFLMSDFLAGSLHPCAAHFIAEHYVFVEGWETYSYYGWLNCLCFNVGYHNEHHDFPNIPWSRLPKVTEMAPEFYENLPVHKSWPLVIWKFIVDPNVGSFNRVKRDPNKEKKAE